MKIKNLVPALALSTVVVPATSMAEVTANAGWVSEYIYRGIHQDDSSASAGLDFTGGLFYAGTWGADVGDGLEYDLYFGIAGGENFTYKVGFTGYYYTDEFDQTYEEVNLGIGYGMFALDVAVGDYDIDDPEGDNYMFGSLTISPEMGPYYKFGTFSDEFDGDYFEIGYTYSIEDAGVDLSVAVLYSDDLPITDSLDNGFGGEEPEEIAEYTLTFGIKKNFSFE